MLARVSRRARFATLTREHTSPATSPPRVERSHAARVLGRLVALMLAQRERRARLAGPSVERADEESPRGLGALAFVLGALSTWT